MNDTPIAAAEVRDFHVRGFLGLDQILTPTELEILRRIYDEQVLTQKIDQAASFHDLARDFPELRSCAFRERGRAVARMLLGDDAELKAEKYMYRPAGHTVPTPWHQDFAFGPPNQLPRRLTIWIPLQDTGVEGGCLWYLPGSHEQDILPHHNRPDIEVGHQKDVDAEVDLEYVGEEQAIPMILPAGGAAIHHCRTLHKADPNRSDEPRRAYVLSFGAPGQERWMKKDSELWPWMAERQGKRTARG